MANEKDLAFLCQRLKELRTSHDCSMDDMVKKLTDSGYPIGNKSTISRVESGKTSEKILIEVAEKYCEVFGMTETQTEQFMRGERIAIPDTSALFLNPQLIDELNEEYSKVIIPKVVVDELDTIKNRNSGSLGRKAWEIIRGISYGPRTISKSYTGDPSEKNADCRIIHIAQEASEEYHCKVEIITNDTDYSAYLKGNDSVVALHLREYMATKQLLLNAACISAIDSFYADSYDSCTIPKEDEINAYLTDGNTLIISAVRNKSVPVEQRKAKIRWLLEHKADINKRDNSRRYFPPLSHAIQMGDFDMFLFLLNECGANPNIGSKNPFDSGRVQQKNEGNMPLMIAAWEGRYRFVEALCKDERTSLNQQDANGFTALMKACMNGHFANDKEKHTWNIKQILIDAGADTKIVDREGRTASDWINEYHKNGPVRKSYDRGNGGNNSYNNRKRW